MSDNYHDPWCFSNEDTGLSSPGGQYRIEYGVLSEIAMGAPIAGECFLILQDGLRVKIAGSAGGPVVWERQGFRVAIPIWSRLRLQKIAVVDVHAKTIVIYLKTFSVLDLQKFDKGVIEGQDSPVYWPKAIQFDTAVEEIELVTRLNY